MATSAKKKKIEKDNPETPDIHFIYRPDDNSMFDNACCGQVINVFVLAHYLHQLQPQNAKLYGGGGGVDFYHPESDVVLAAMHAEKFHPSTLPDHIYGASIELLVQPGQQKYYPKERCGIRSKPFNAPTEICFQPIHFKVLLPLLSAVVTGFVKAGPETVVIAGGDEWDERCTLQLLAGTHQLGTFGRWEARQSALLWDALEGERVFKWFRHGKCD